MGEQQHDLLNANLPEGVVKDDFKQWYTGRDNLWEIEVEFPVERDDPRAEINSAYGAISVGNKLRDLPWIASCHPIKLSGPEAAHDELVSRAQRVRSAAAKRV